MLKYHCKKPTTTIKNHTETIPETQPEPSTYICYILLLPIELLTRIFVLAQNPLLVQSCRHFWQMGASTTVRAHYLLHRYGSHQVLSNASMRRKIVSLPVVEHLLRLHQCDPNAGGDDWLFRYACQLNQTSLCRLIIDRSLSLECLPNEKNKRLLQLLSIACMKGAADTIDLLVCDYNVGIHRAQETALTLACKENQLETVKHLYTKYGCDIHMQQEKLLRDACLYGYKDLVEFFISNDADVQAYNNAALQNAAYKGFSRLVKLLLDAGANAEANQNVCMQHAINNGDIETVEYLITIGRVDARFNQYWPLKQACRKGLVELVDYLIRVLSKDDKIENVTDVNNGMPLQECLKYGKIKTVQLLLQRGADPNSKGAVRGIKHVMDPKCKLKIKDDILNLMIEAGLDSNVVKSTAKPSSGLSWT
ncbi:hypothetical protein INT48_008142 [Thamnidium elegans]|uniref:Uncharacterized protein n=1 Tax=Thamnidium elegans TaxID=101142 RepID=A0A8H7W127_9FUNG|nr:hypothetical protein INT48_008142 [Thamnidium elegans]